MAAMSETVACSVCKGSTRLTTIPVRVERGGREVLKLLVPARVCERCQNVGIEDEVTEEVISTLEQNTEPGDDIIFPGGGPTLH
jgi:hypothetical protein